jgi:hypothetical protein
MTITVTKRTGETTATVTFEETDYAIPGFSREDEIISITRALLEALEPRPRLTITRNEPHETLP